MLDHNTFSGTRGNRSGKIVIVGESWGKTEAYKKLPFMGESGKDLERLLFESKIPISECFFTNVINERPDNNDMRKFFFPTTFARENNKVEIKGLYPHDNVLEGIRTLRSQIDAIKPEIIVGLGNYASWALCDTGFSIADDEGYKVPSGITQWRGSQLYSSKEFGAIPYLPTYHPAAAMRTHAWRYMIKHDFKARIPKALSHDWAEPEYDFQIQPSFKAVTDYLLRLLSLLDKEPTELVLDLETSPKRQLISCIGLSYEIGSAMCIPLLCSYREDGYWSEVEEYEIVLLLRRILSHHNLRLIGHNLLFDLQYIIDQLFVKPRIYFDTMIGHHTLWPGGGNPNDPDSEQNVGQGIQRKALYNCASLYCNHYYFWKDEGKDFGDNTGRDELTGWAYNCRDCVKTFEVYKAEVGLLERFELQPQFELQMRVTNDEALPMMVRGIKENKEEKQKALDALTVAMKEFDTSLYNMVPEDIRREIEPKTWKKNKETGVREKTAWFTSPTQQKKILYDYMGIKPVYAKTKDKNGEKKPTLNKEALPILAQREPIIAPLVDKLETRRSIGVFRSTFAKAKSDPDGRMRCAYNPAGTDTFRFASSSNIYDRGGNFQNIPSGKEEESFDFPNMRRGFEPDAGYELAEFDLSGADATIVAWEANDEGLKEAFRRGIKIHLFNARTLFPHETRNMTDDEIKAGSGIPGSYYDSVKKGCHATNYGAEPPTLAHRLRWTNAKAEEFQEKWFTAHPGIRSWQNRTERYLNGLQCWKCDSFTNGSTVCPVCHASTGRAVSNKFGYRIVYFDAMNDLLKKALAWQAQSSVAINCNKGALSLVDNVPHVELLLQVHDSLVVQYPIQYSSSILSDCKQALHSVSVPYADPLTIQWSVKASRKSWGDCEKVDW